MYSYRLNVVKIWFSVLWVEKGKSGANNSACLNDNVYRVRRADESFGTPCKGIMARSGMKRDRNMRNTTMPKRAISVVLAAVLACTLMPSASLAYAAEDARSSSAAAGEAQTQSTNDAEGAGVPEDGAAPESADAVGSEGAAANGEAAGSSAASANSDAAASGAADAASDGNAARPQTITESRALTATDTAQNGVAQAAAVERVTANVTLGQQAGALFTYNGLTYEVVSADRAEAALVGLSSTALEGALEVPAQVSDGATTYTVAAVKNCGGGVRFPRLPQPTVK